jgi:RNA polymerase sigma-70 factor (ECF subfamily)
VSTRLETVSEPQEAFKALLMPLLDAAYGWALHATRNHADAEDLVQEAVLNSLRAFHTFQAGTNFKAWFFRILMNCFYSSYRKRRSEKVSHSIDDAPELFIMERSIEAGFDIGGSDPARTAMARIHDEHVAQALQQLPEEFRDVATLYFVEEFTYQELADMLNIPIGTVRSRLHRARRLLQKELWHLAYE